MRKYISTFFLFVCIGSANAQQWVTSFLQASPLSYNPALTGLMASDVRAIVNYENQNDYNRTAINSLYASCDMALLKGIMPHKGDALGVGVLYHSWGSNGPYYSIQNTFMGISLGYHKALDKKGRHHLSLGVQTTLSTYEYRSDIYGSPYDERGNGYRSNYNWGVLYSGMLSEVTSLYGGFSRYGSGVHYNNDRYTALVGMTRSLGANNTLFGNVSYDDDLRVGLYDRFVLNPKGKGKPIAAYAGTVFIYDQSLLAYIGFEIANFRLGLGIDTRTFSGDTPTGDYQVSLTYNGVMHSKKGNNWHCPALY